MHRSVPCRAMCRGTFRRLGSVFPRGSLEPSPRLVFYTKAITQDIERFADSVAELYSNITKPVLDMVVYVRRLSDKVRGWEWSGVEWRGDAQVGVGPWR